MPAVSVVIPTHDRADLVRRAVASVLRQSFDDVEVIVVDDASTDNTVDRLKQLDDERLRILQSDRNAGQAHARNRAIEAACGDWIAFLDDDDEWLPGKLRRQLGRAAETGAPVVYGPYLLGLGDRVLTHRIDLPEGMIFEKVVGGWAPPLTSTLMVRRDVIEPYDPGLVGVEDLDLLLRLTRRHSVAACLQPLAIVDKSPGVGRHTSQAELRVRAIDALERRWEARLDDDLGQVWDRTCDALRTVAWLTVGDSPTVSTLSLMGRALSPAVPRRTRVAGLVRLVAGRRGAVAAQRLLFRLRGTDRSEVLRCPES